MSNNFSITLDNFQSISSAELTFEQGINIIVGQSNSGKSAILRAIKAVLLNPNGSARYIKKHTDKATVTVDYNANYIEWDRKKKESSYIVNGESFGKTGNSNAFKITNDNTGFTLDSSGNLMNIESELELPFPFDRSPSELFKLFENVFCVSDSATILKAFKEEEDNTQKQLNEVNNSIKITNEKIGALQALKDEVNLERLRTYKTKLISLNDQQTTLREDLKQLSLSQSIINRIKLNKDYSDIILQDKGVSDYKNVLLDYNKAKQTIKLLKLAKTLTLKVNFNNDLLNTYSNIKDDYTKLKNVSKVVSLLDDKKEINIDLELYSEYNKLYKDYVEIKESMQHIKSLKDKQEELKNTISKCNSKLKEYKVCPLCGHELE